MDSEKKCLKSCCGSYADLKEYLQEKAKNHNYYKWYSKREYIENCIKDRGLYLSNGAKWNDIVDRSAFNSESADVVRFGLCFSFSKSESVAMWMLYGGMAKDGAMIDIGKRCVNKMLDKSVIKLGKFKNDNFYPLCEIIPDDYSIELIDMVYVGNSDAENVYTVKRSDERIDSVDLSVIENIDYYKKAYAWNYENECRLIVTIPQAKVPAGASHVKLPILDKVADELSKRIYHAPNYMGEILYNSSTLNSMIDWDLCKKCHPSGFGISA